jgi:hypothetical protein
VKQGREIEVGPLVAAVGAVVLIVSLFLDWYADFSAFTVFEVWDLVLVCLGIVALLQVAESLGLTPEGSPLRSGALLPIGAVAFAIVVSQLINHPPAGIDRDPSLGLWLGLGGSAVLLVGGLLATARISLAVDVERDDRRRRAPAAPTEAARAEPAAQDELAPDAERSGPIGEDDPETRRTDPGEPRARG